MKNPQHVAQRAGGSEIAKDLPTSANDASDTDGAKSKSTVRQHCFAWDPSTAFDGLVCGLPVAAAAAVEYAEHVFETDAEDRGLDWASRVQHRCDASPDQLARFLPKFAPPRVREAALRHMAGWS